MLDHRCYNNSREDLLTGNHLKRKQPRPLFTKKTPSYWYRDSIINMRRSPDHLLGFIIGIPIVVTWCHQTETFSTLLGLWEGNSPVNGEFPSKRPVTRSFDVFFDLCLNKRLSKPSRHRSFETPSRSLWRHRNEDGVSLVRGPAVKTRQC